jgi:hypothetical protein
MGPEYLMKRNAPARAVIAPEPHDVRGLLFLPRYRLRTVLFFKGKRRVNVHRSIQGKDLRRRFPGSSLLKTAEWVQV